jgi:protein TonB
LHAEPARKPEVPKPRARPEGNAAAPRKPDARPTNTMTEPQQAAAEAAAQSSPQDTEVATDSQAAVVPAMQSASAPPATSNDAPAAVASAPVVEVEVEIDLKPLFQPQPEIPRDMRASIANGRVVLGFTVQPDGTVREAAILRTTNRRLGKPALDAVSQWRFEPIRVARTAQVEIEFNLQQ